MNYVEIILIVILVMALAGLACLNEGVFSKEAYADSEDVFVVNKPEEPPQELLINVEYTYIPTEGYENIEAIAPEDVVNLDEFEQIACMLAQTIYGEGRGLTKYEQSLICWCIFNRYDNGKFGETLADVITAKGQFYGYKAHHPIDKELYSMAIDCLLRWQAEKYSVGDVGRTLPKEYLYFYGDGKHNYYRTSYKKSEAKIFDFKGADPYGDRPF